MICQASGKKVFIDGVDILARVETLDAVVGNMSAMIGQLRLELRESIAGLTTAPSTVPTTSGPSAAPSSGTPTSGTPTPPPTTLVPTNTPSRGTGSLLSEAWGGFRIFRLPGLQRPSGNDARGWYRDHCMSYGLRPVVCDDGTHQCEPGFQPPSSPRLLYQW